MAPRTEQQNQAIRAESTERILQAALALFARFGFERTSVRMIAREAGVSQGLLYNYFDSKDDLLHALFARSMADVQDSFAGVDDATDPAESLERLIRQSFEIMRQHQAFWRLLYSLRMQPAVLAGLRDDTAQWIASINQTLVAQFVALGDPNPSIRAATLFALIDGVSQHYTLDPEHYPLSEITDEIVATYCRRAPVPR